MLTAPPILVHKTRPLLVLLLFAWASAAPGDASARSTLGVPLPKGAKAEGEHRYRCRQDFASTVQFLERRLSKPGARVEFERMIDLPDVIAAHATSPSAKTRWSGINVSRYGGHTWIFVIKRE